MGQLLPIIGSAADRMLYALSFRSAAPAGLLASAIERA
jgi:hypothetical protein